MLKKTCVETIKDNPVLFVAYLLLTAVTISARIYLLRAVSADSDHVVMFAISETLLMADLVFSAYIFYLHMNSGALAKRARQAREEAEHASEAKSRFLANMSHEIRTPMTAILGMNEMILRETDQDSVKRYAGNIESAGSSLLSLINDILDFSKIESGKLELVNGDYESAKLFYDLDVMFRSRAEDKGLDLRFLIDDKIPKLLNGDELRVKQICMNLLSNAIKYTDKGNIVFTVTSDAINDTCSLRISVKDTGRGILKGDVPTLFDKFQRSDLKHNNTIEGTGLGLSIVKTLTEAMGGDVEVSSIYGAGSTFTATIIQNISDKAPMGNYTTWHGTKADKRQTFVAPDAKILVVDDTEMNLEVIANLLKRTMIQVDTASSGRECIDKIYKDWYDIILMDARMPQMDGVETLQEIKEKGLAEGSKIIVLTANAMSGSREMYLKKGFDGYLAKPVRPDILEDTIRSMLSKVKVQEVEEDVEEDELPALLRHLPYIDPKIGLELCGTADTYVSTAISFSKYSRDHVSEMDTCLSEGDIEGYTIKVHALKSSARLIGAIELSDKAKLLEEAGNRKDEDYIRKHAEEVFRQYMIVSHALEPLYAEEPKADKGPVEAEDVPGILRHLKAYVEEFNDEAVDSMLSALSHHKFPGREQERFDKLVKAHENVDWAAMEELLEDV